MPLTTCANKKNHSRLTLESLHDARAEQSRNRELGRWRGSTDLLNGWLRRHSCKKLRSQSASSSSVSIHAASQPVSQSFIRQSVSQSVSHASASMSVNQFEVRVFVWLLLGVLVRPGSWAWSGMMPPRCLSSDVAAVSGISSSCWVAAPYDTRRWWGVEG